LVGQSLDALLCASDMMVAVALVPDDEPGEVTEVVVLEVGALWAGLSTTSACSAAESNSRRGSFPHGSDPPEGRVVVVPTVTEAPPADGRLAAQLAMRHTDLSW